MKENTNTIKTLRLTYAPTNKETKDKQSIIKHGLFLTHIIQLSRALNKIGVTTTFFSKGKKQFNERIMEFKVFRIQKPQQPFFMLYGRRAMKQINSFKKEDKIDIVHSHNPAYAYYFGLNRKALKGRPLVITWHGFFPYKTYRLGKIHEFFLKRLARFAHFIAISQPSVKQLRKLGVTEDRINFITAGYDPKIMYDTKRKREYFLFVGRFVDWKNTETVLRAFKIVLKNSPGERLVIVGDGVLKNSLIDKAMELGISKAVEFKGSIKATELSKIYSGAKATVVPHKYDSFGKTVIESLACSTPVICTNDDIPKNLEKFLVSFPVSKAEDEILLAKKMVSILKNKQENLLKAKEASLFAEKNYSWDAIARQTNNVYENALNKNKGVEKK